MNNTDIFERSNGFFLLHKSNTNDYKIFLIPYRNITSVGS